MAKDIELEVDLKADDVLSKSEELGEAIKGALDTGADKQLSKELKNILSQFNEYGNKISDVTKQITELGDKKILNPEYAEASKQFTLLENKVKRTKAELDKLPSAKVPTYQYQQLVDDLKAAGEEAIKTRSRLDQLTDKNAQHSTSKLRSDIKKYSNELKEIVDHMTFIKSKMDDLKNSGKAFKVSEYDVKKAEYDAQVKELEALKQQIPKIQPEISAVNREQYKNLVKDLETVNNQVTVTKSKLDELADNGNKSAQEIQQAFNSAQQTFKQIVNPVELLQIGFQRLISATVNVGSALRTMIGNAILSGLRKLGDLAKNAAIKFAMIPLKAVITGLQKIAQLAKTAAINLAKMIASPIIRGAKSLAKNLLHIGKSSDSNNMSLKKGLRMFIRYGLGMRSLFALINKLRKALTDGLGQMAESFEPFGSVVSDFKNSIELLKGSVASVAAPILQQVLPALTAFINKLSEGITMIGKFVVALQGKSMFVKATSAVADTGKKATKALKNTAKAAKEAQRELFSFDQINRFSSQNDSNTGSDTDTGDDSDTPNITFEEVPIENAISELANKIRAFIQNEDWAGLGEFLGNSINSVFQKAKDLLTSQELYDKIDWFVNAITTTFNSLVSAVNWPLIGQTFAAGINLILYTINSLLTGINWFNLGYSLARGLMGLVTDLNWPLLGQTLANYVNTWISFIHGAILGFDFRLAAHNLMVALNNFISTVHWGELGTTLSNFMIGILNFLSTAIQDFNWDNLATAITQFLGGINWNGIVDALSEFIGTAFGWGVKLQNFIWGIIKDAWDKMMEDWNKRVEDAGGDIWKALTGAIKEKFSGIWDWLKQHVVDPFMRGFNGLFGISSGYSSELKNAGSDLGEGMYRGILSKFSDLYNWIKSHMVDPVISNVETLFGINSTDGSSKFKSIGLQLIAGLWNGIQEAMNPIPGLLENVFGDKKQDGFLSKIMSIFDINSPSKKMFDIGGNLVKGLSNGIEQDTTFNSMISKFTNLASSIERSFNDINWSNIGANICYGIQNGINSGWNWLQNTVTNMAYSLYNSARWALGIFSPSRVFRDGVGKMIPAGIAVGVDKNADTAISSINDLSKSIAGTDIQLPSIVAGKVVPYSSQGADNSILNALNNLTDMLEYNQLDTISRTDLETIITTAIQRYGRIDFYIGDEQIARHANAGNVKLDKRYKPSIA